MNTRQEELRRRLTALGFDAVRFAKADMYAGAAQGLQTWIEKGMHADMGWMERTVEKRMQPDRVLAGVQSVIVLGVNYWPENEPLVTPPESDKPRWARYALHEDYHDTIKPALIEAGRVIEQLYGVSGEDYRYYVDTGPVLERNWAAESGVGFVGKNAMLISRDFGNWLFLAVIFTRIDLAPDEPLQKQFSVKKNDDHGVGLLCGKCTRCIDACPTHAIVEPGVVDARLCVSYQTIENKGIIPRELREGIGSRVYGCDVCLEVCPWNRFAQNGRSVLLAARHELTQISLRELLDLMPDRFASVFRKTAIKRVKLAGLLRNACIVAGNTKSEDCIEALVKLAGEGAAIVRPHAVWAVYKIAGKTRADELLKAVKVAEQDAEVLAEYTWWERDVC